MAAALEEAIAEIRRIQKKARAAAGPAARSSGRAGR